MVDYAAPSQLQLLGGFGEGFFELCLRLRVLPAVLLLAAAAGVAASGAAAVVATSANAAAAAASVAASGVAAGGAAEGCSWSVSECDSDVSLRGSP